MRSQARNVSLQQALALRVPQRRAEHHVHLADRHPRERAATTGAADVRQLRILAIEVDCADLLDRYAAKRWLDVNADQPPVTGDCRWPAAGNRKRREPVIEVRLERDATRANVRAVLELGEGVVERGLRVLPRAEPALTDLLAPPVAPTDVQHETPRAPASLDASRPAHREHGFVQRRFGSRRGRRTLPVPPTLVPIRS